MRIAESQGKVSSENRPFALLGKCRLIAYFAASDSVREEDLRRITASMVEASLDRIALATGSLSQSSFDAIALLSLQRRRLRAPVVQPIKQQLIRPMRLVPEIHLRP